MLRTLRAQLASLGTLALLVLPVAAQAPAVFVVDPLNGPGTDFTTLQPAIDAAAEGDYLLLRQGTYAGTIDGKSLTLQSREDKAWATLDLEVTGIQAGQHVALRGVALAGNLHDNQGALRVEDADITGDVGFGGGRELFVSACADLVFRSVSLADFFCGGAMEIRGTGLCAYDSVLQGNTGSDGGRGEPQCDTEPAITVLSASELYLHGCTVTGGSANPSVPPFGQHYCPAPAVQAYGQPVELVDSILRAGFGTDPACPSINAVEGSTPYLRPGTARRVVSPSPVFEGMATTVELHGDPGDMVFLASAPTPALSAYFPVLGVYHASRAESDVLLVRTIPASGVLAVPITAPLLSPGEEARSYYLQALFVSPSGERQLSAPTQVHLFAAQFQ